jgi:signal transduction histidine kinase
MTNNVETQLQRTERILEISCELNSTVSLEPLLHKIVEAAAELTDSEAASILLLDERAGTLRFIAASMLGDQLADIPVPVEGSIAGATFSSGEPQVVHDVPADPRYYKEVERLVGLEASSLLAVPLQFRDRRIGVLESENKRDGRRFDQDDVETLTMLASQAAVAIENARLVEALRETHDLAEALRQTAASLRSSLKRDDVLERILEQIGWLFPQTAANIMLIEGEEVRVHHGHGYELFGTDHDLTSISLRLADVNSLQRMKETERPLVIPNVECCEDWVLSRPEHTWIKSYIGVPICIRDQVIGFLNVNSATIDFFGQADSERLPVFADHVAIAIENARLYQQAQQELAERQRAEAELRKHRDHLEEVVAERTAELTSANEQLHQHTAELEARNEELDAFAHTVAHDLKGPLGNVVGYTSLLFDTHAAESLDAETREALERIEQTADKMVNIVDALLLLASVRKMEEIKMGPLDMASIVADAKGRLANLIEKHQAEIILPGSWPQALGYGPWVEEVWINYLSNALKHGGRPPRVEFGAAEQADDTVRFWVRDNGSGLKPEEQARLFVPFTRLDQVQSKGHGLGLSIVRRIVEKLGGQVDVESEIGQGSVFSFTLQASPSES